MHDMYSLMRPYGRIVYSQHPIVVIKNTLTHITDEGTPPPVVRESYLLCGAGGGGAQGPSPQMYHQSFKAIKHFSMRIASSSLSKTERSDSQSHFLPNPIKGGEGRGEKNEVEDLKWRAFI